MKKISLEFSHKMESGFFEFWTVASGLWTVSPQFRRAGVQRRDGL